MALVLPVWVFIGFIVAQLLVVLVWTILKALGLTFDTISEATFQTILSAVVYIFTLGIVIGIPWAVKKYRTTTKELGIDQSVTWTDIVLAPTGFIAYVILSLIFTSIASNFSFYNADQVQDTGFTHLSHQYEYFLAFATLVIIAPIAEEIVFRGYLLGKLRKFVPLWSAILITSILFGIVHFAWNVGVDVFALSIVLCVLRVWTGRLWPSILLHMTKNGLAFFLLFINPLL